MATPNCPHDPHGLGSASIPGDPGDPRGLCALLQRYLVWMETHHFARNTVRVRQCQLGRFLQWCDDRAVTHADDLSPLLIASFQRYLFYYRQRGGQSLSVASQCHWLTSLRGWMKWLVKQRVLESDPAQELELPKGGQRLPRHPLSVEEVEAVLEQPDVQSPYGLRMRAILEVLYSTGLRRQEVLRLELADVDRSRRVILVRQGKGHKDRYVPLGARALAWIDRYLAEARPLLCQDPGLRLLFPSAKGRPLHPNCISSQVRRYMNAVGIAKAGSCHLFRHTAASLMLDRGADVRHVQEILGHKNLATTQVYTHVSITRLCEVHERTHPARLEPPEPSEPVERPSDPPSPRQRPRRVRSRLRICLRFGWHRLSWRLWRLLLPRRVRSSERLADAR